MRNEVSGMMTTQGMQVSADFAAHLDQLVQTGDARFRLMDGMMAALGRLQLLQHSELNKLQLKLQSTLTP